MFASLLKPKLPEGTAPSELEGATPDKAAQPSFSVVLLTLQNGRVHFRDDLPKGGFKASVEEIALALKNVANRPEQTGQYDLSLLVDREIRLASKGSFTLAEPAAKASVQLTGLQLQKGWPYLAEYLTAPLKGVVDLSGEVAFSGKNGLTAEKGSLAVKDFSARYGSREGLDLARLTLTGASFNQKANRLEIDQLRLSQGDVSLSREADGQLSVQSLLVPQEKGQPAEMTVAAPARQPAPAKQECRQTPRLPPEADRDRPIQHRRHRPDPSEKAPLHAARHDAFSGRPERSRAEARQVPSSLRPSERRRPSRPRAISPPLPSVTGAICASAACRSGISRPTTPRT